MNFAPLERKRLSDYVVQRIVDLVASGTYQIGDKLPSERELASRLEVSRTLVRESLRMLESMGMVEVRPGVGAIVTQQGPRNVEIATFLWAHPVETLEVIEVREMLVMLCGELAAQRVTPEEVSELQRLILAQKSANEGGRHQELAQLDEQFHSLIFHAARNDVLRVMERHSRSILDNVQWNLLTLSLDSSTSIQEHERILNAIQSGDSDEAGRASRDHAKRTLAALRRVAIQKLENPSLEHQHQRR